MDFEIEIDGSSEIEGSRIEKVARGMVWVIIRARARSENLVGSHMVAVGPRFLHSIRTACTTIFIYTEHIYIYVVCHITFNRKSFSSFVHEKSRVDRINHIEKSFPPFVEKKKHMNRDFCIACSSVSQSFFSETVCCSISASLEETL